NHVMLANDGGGAITDNVAARERTWSGEEYATGQFYHVITTKHVPYHVCGAQQDNSTLCVSSATNLGGRGGGGGCGRGNVEPPYQAGGGEPGYIAPDPKDPDVFYAGANNGSFLTRLNRRTGELKEVGAYPRFFSGENSSEVHERWQWTYPIIFSPVDANVLYTSSQRVWKTTNGGQTWTAISGDLTRHDPKTFQDSGGPITHDMNSPEMYGTVFSLGPGKTDVNVIWSGSDDGIVQVTRDGGKTWTNVTPREMPDLGRVSQIDASAFDAASAYVSVKKPLLEDFSPYIFRTHDYGRTWTKIVAGIKGNDYISSVREDPVRRGLLYAGAEHGFYVSMDDGDHWQSLSLNLPDTQVSDIWVEGGDVAIATHGRGFYILDDVNPLRQYGAAVTATDAYLFKPGDAIRAGGVANISYWLKKPAEKMTLEILDSKNQVVRSYTGALPGRAGGWRARTRRAAAVDGRRSAALHLGSAGAARRPVPRHGAVGRDAERSARRAWHVSGAAHDRRQGADAVVRCEEASVSQRDRRRPAGTVRPGDPDSRQGERREQRDHPDSPHQAGAARPRIKDDERGREGNRRATDQGADRGRGGRLSGQESEQSGSAELPHQDQQSPGVTAARRRSR
ncbi:MAG: glycosyl hydrolase, partial [Acidobacteria bacterium]|nr:glycosyl hydrolase [Acidobacteriota bacterium]